MALNSDYITGIGRVPLPDYEHKELIMKIYDGLKQEHFNDDYNIKPEHGIEKYNNNAKAPDIVLYQGDDEIAQIIIEITLSSELSKIKKKITKLITEYKEAGLREAFIYVYDTEEWICILKDEELEEQEEYPDNDQSYSAILEISFNYFI